MEAPSVQKLEAMKYSELQKLAKGAGLRANMRADKLLKALKAYYHPECKTESLSEDSESNSNLDTDELNSSQEKNDQAPVCHITHRRGRGKKTIQTEASPKLELSANDAGSGSALQALENEPPQVVIGEDKNDVLKTPSSEKASRKRQRAEAETSEKEASEMKKPTVSESKKCARPSQDNGVTGAPPAGKIPRYTGRVSKPPSKPTTPNFKKMHEAHFKKMESIDKYMERKQKRLDAVSSTLQEVKILAKKSNLLKLMEKTPVSNSKKPVQGKLSLQSPAPRKSLQSPVHKVSPSPARTPANKRRSGRGSMASKSILVDRTGFKPSVFSSSKMNVRFSEATKDNEYKRSLIKTPARKSCYSAVTPTSELRRSTPTTRKSDVKPLNLETPAEKTLPLVTTPFTFTAQNAMTPSTANKSKFDLQASLAKPLGYQPHKGKLKPWTESKENSALKTNVSLLKSNFKQPHLQSREERRNQQEKDRKIKRNQTVGTRRGMAAH
ncbi:nucleolar and spindle-associated protein 1 [Discoglossus pictus]